MLERFQRRHGERYEYESASYVNESQKMTMRCREHGVFHQRPYCHAAGHGCPHCKYEQLSRNQRLTLPEILERFRRANRKRYDYSLVTPTRNCNGKVSIVCRKHGVFRQSVTKHAGGEGCPACCESHGERQVARALDELGLPYMRQRRFTTCRDKKPLPFDFYVPSECCLIEFDGPQHYQPSRRFNWETIQRHDTIKTERVARHGFRLIRIPYHQLHNIPQILRSVFDTSRLESIACLRPPQQSGHRERSLSF
jgi:very-short-patch-repair endonuclease